MTKIILIVFWTMSNAPAGPLTATFEDLPSCRVAAEKISADLKNVPFAQLKILSINCFEQKTESKN